MDLSPIVERLRTCLSTLALREIEQAVGLEPILRGAVSVLVPAVYVVPLAEDGEPPLVMGAQAQREHRLFGVISVVSVPGASAAARALTDFATLRAHIKGALLGFVPVPEDGEPVYFASGELVEMTGNGRLIWSDEYAVAGFF